MENECKEVKMDKFLSDKENIKESLEELFVVECEGCIESMQEQLISFSQNTLNIHLLQSFYIYSFVQKAF